MLSAVSRFCLAFLAVFVGTASAQDSVDELLQRAAAALAKQEYTQAIELARTVLAADRNHRPASAVLGEALLATGVFAEAFWELGGGLPLDDADPSTPRLRALRERAAQGWIEQVEAWCAGRPGVAPSESFFRELQQRRDDGAVVTLCTRALQRGLDDVFAAHAALRMRADVYERQGDFARAVADLARAAEVMPPSTPPWPIIRALAARAERPGEVAAQMCEEARAFADAANHQAALERAQTAAALLPAYADARLLAAAALRALGRDEDAIEPLLAAQACAPARRDEIAPLLRETAIAAAARLSATMRNAPPAGEEAVRVRRRLASLHVLSGRLDEAFAICDALVAETGKDWAYVLRAQVHDLRGDRARALADYREGVHGCPSTDPNWPFLIALLRESGDLEGMLAEAWRALEADADDEQAQAWRAEALERLGRVEEARTLLDVSLGRRPQALLLVLQRHGLARRTGDLAQARADAMQLVEAGGPGYASTAAWLVRDAFDRGEGARIGRFALELAARYGKSAPGHVLYAFVHHQEGEFAGYYIRKARENGCDDVELHELGAIAGARNSEPLFALRELRAGLARGLGKAWLLEVARAVESGFPRWHDVEEYRKWLPFLTALVELDPSLADVAGIRGKLDGCRYFIGTDDRHRAEAAALARAKTDSQARYEPAREAEGRGELDAALEGYTAALAIWPEHRLAVAHRAALLLARGDVAAARETVRAAEVAPKTERSRTSAEADAIDAGLAALRADGKLDAVIAGGPMPLARALRQLARIYEMLLDDATAIELLSAGIDQAPDADLLLERANHRFAANDWRGMREDLQRAIELRPDDVDVRLRAANLVSGSEDPAAAMAIADEAVARWPQSAKALFGRGEILFEQWVRTSDQALLARALDDAKRSEALDASIDTWRLLAMVHDARGEAEQAFAWLERVFQRDPAAWLPDLKRSHEIRYQEFLGKMRAAYVEGMKLDEQRLERLAEEREREELRRKVAEIEARNARRETRVTRESLDGQVASAMCALEGAGRSSGGDWSNWNTGIQLGRAIDAEQQRNARMHEIERRFGFYSRAAESARRNW